MDNVKSKIERMENHDIDAIKSGMDSGSAFLKLNAIIHGAKERIDDKDFIKKVNIETKNNKDCFMGIPMSAFAKAGMEIFRVRRI